METKQTKRITVKPKQPNPLFEQWLTEWRDQAKEKESKMQYCFSLALSTLRKYPLPLESGKDCKILKGFGDKLCKMLDDKLKEHRALNGNVPQNTLPSPKRKSLSPQKEYMPKSRSGGFAILVGMYEQSEAPGFTGFLTKNEIVAKCQDYCDVSLTKPGPDSKYTGWSSMKTLLEKNLVTKEGNPARFSLTNQGMLLGEKLYIQLKVEEFQKAEKEQVLEKSFLPGPSSNAQKIWKENSANSDTSETAILAPNSYEIVLLVDTQEVGSKTGENDPIIRELKHLNVRHEVRNLKIGDYAWICKDSSNELVLPYIVERKRMDDFGSSIKDDRFHEQKFRLKQSGIQHLIYLIESHGRNEHVGLPLTTLHQAAVNTLIHDNFCVKFTENSKATCQYLATLSKFFTGKYSNKTLVNCAKDDLPAFDANDDLFYLMSFTEFNKTSSKTRNWKVKEMFVKQLIQVKGMSVEKALAIVEKYPTPMLLKSAFDQQGEKLLVGVKYGALNKNVGAVLSTTLHQLFCNATYN